MPAPVHVRVVEFLALLRTVTDVGGAVSPKIVGSFRLGLVVSPRPLSLPYIFVFGRRKSYLFVWQANSIKLCLTL